MNRNTGKVWAAPRALQIGMTIALSLAVLALPGCASKSRGGSEGSASTARSGSDVQTSPSGDSGDAAGHSKRGAAGTSRAVATVDTDGDGVPDAVMVDTDGDGVPDRVANVDTDGDGIRDAVAVDTDGDGVPDAVMVDTDGDGVPDKVANVDTDGDGIRDAVAVDTDGDGVPDAIMVDTDGDGVPDKVANVDTDGDGIRDAVAVDTDGDGVPDAVMVDTDGDGVPDTVANLDTDGDGVRDAVAVDTNGDGIPDAVIKHATARARGTGGDKAAAGTVDAPGSQVRIDEEVTPQTLGGMLPLTVGVDEEGQFDFDQAVLRADVKSVLDELASKLADAEWDRLDVIGYTDRIGTDEYNQQLSERRAWAVARYLMDRGVPLNKLKVEGRGKRNSTVADGECRDLARDELIACLQKDRRVDIEASIRKTNARLQ
jgi:outer membrane protein OmpA-like peptidoglycan-associated protein